MWQPALYLLGRSGEFLQCIDGDRLFEREHSCASAAKAGEMRPTTCQPAKLMCDRPYITTGANRHGEARRISFEREQLEVMNRNPDKFDGNLCPGAGQLVGRGHINFLREKDRWKLVDRAMKDLRQLLHLGKRLGHQPGLVSRNAICIE